ncbi:MAG: 30S ribosomal protein S4e [Candidatus Nanohaloarchaeota archaeon QJJ-7]|nr:30S ribosomal protein S4e [Candidatus Nanohaloarchaeota archaeon QJJ-7]
MTKHQKRMSSPGDYPVNRNDGAYVVKAEGPHPDERGVPLAVVLRDVLGYVDSMDEAKQVMGDGEVLVNGSKRSNPGSNLGFMDVLSFPGLDEHYRVLVTDEGFLMKEVDEDEAGEKLAKVADKTTLKGGKTQLNLHDGNNIETEDGFDTRSSVLVTLPDLEIEEEIGFEEGNTAYVVGGKHVGKIAEILSIEIQPGSQENTVKLGSGDEEFQTVEDNVYMVGEDEPVLEVDTDE